MPASQPAVKHLINGTADEVIARHTAAIAREVAAGIDGNLGSVVAVAQKDMDEALDRLAKLRTVAHVMTPTSEDEALHLRAITDEHAKLVSGLARLLWPVM